MRKLILAALLLMSLFVSRPTAAHPAQQEPNLLQNPGFEGSYSPWGGIGPIQVAAGWTPWWFEDQNHNPQYFRPEWKPAEGQFFPYRVRSGSRAQQWFTFHASHVAGMYQQVFNVTPGQRYRFTIWTQVWSSVDDNPRVSNTPANPRLRVGIDPQGFWDPFAARVVWSPEAPMSQIIDRWGVVAVEAVAESDVITVMMWTNPDFANKHNDTYWDDASLTAVGDPAPPPTSTSPPPPPPTTPAPQPPTPVPPPTELPTATATATAAATATNTAEPTIESTDPPPTATRVPTETAAPPTTVPPTVTPSPSETSGAVTLAPTSIADNSVTSAPPGSGAGVGAGAMDDSGEFLVTLLLVLLLVGAVLLGVGAIVFIILRNRAA